MPSLIQKMKDGTLVRQWDLGRKTFAVGRGDRADAVVDDAEMSRQHFSVVPRDDGYVLRDGKSKNGTFVNGRKVTEVKLKPNDKIVAGQTLFAFVDGLQTAIRLVESKGCRYSSVIRGLKRAK